MNNRISRLILDFASKQANSFAEQVEEANFLLEEAETSFGAAIDDMQVETIKFASSLFKASLGNFKALTKHMVRAAYSDVSQEYANTINKEILRISDKIAQLKSMEASAKKAQSKSGRAPSLTLLDAVGEGDYAKSKELLESGADPNVKKLDNWTPLMLAAQNDFEDIVHLLLKHGADIDIHYKDGSSALSFAAFVGNPDTVGELILHGADIDLADDEGKSPLFKAVEQGNLDAVELLLDKGADLALKDIYGKLPIDYAREFDHQRIVDLLVDGTPSSRVSKLARQFGIVLAFFNEDEDTIHQFSSIEEGSSLQVAVAAAKRSLLSARDIESPIFIEDCWEMV